MSNRLRSFLIIIMSVVIVAAALPLRAIVVNAEGEEYWTITYDSNNGSGDVTTQQVIKGEQAQIASNSFTYEGHISSGIWKDAGDVTYIPGSTVDVNSDMTLMAQWNEAVTISFDANGGAGEMASQTAVKGSDITLSPNSFFGPAEDGKIFAGWSTQADGNGTKYTDKATVSNVQTSITLYAQWRLPCEITFSKNYFGVTEDMPNQIIGQGYDTPLNANKFERPGYVFLGWALTSDATYESFKDGQLFNYGADKVTLYAVWAEERTITFYPNGATGEAYTQKVGKDHQALIEACRFTREYYRFDGWTTDPSNDTCSYWEGSSVILSDSNLTLYAHWSFDSANSVKITFDKNSPEATGEMPVQFAHKTTPAVLNQNTYAMENKSFKGWNTQADGNGTPYDDKATTTFTTDTTLYAQWVDNCKLTLHSNIDGNDETYEQTVGLGVPTLADTTKFTWEHHAITSWTEYADGTGASYPADAPITATGDMELYAQWTSYTITFVHEDGTTILQQSEWAPGETPKFTEPIPVKEPTTEFTYKLTDWTPKVVPVTGDQTYTAVFSPVPRKYTIRFVNDDEAETLIWSTDVEYNSVPVYNGPTPTKEPTAEYSFVWAGWTEDLSAVTGEKTYKATYTSAKNVYTISFVNYDGTLLKDYQLEYGSDPLYDGDKPVRPSNTQFSYVFTGWDTPATTVVGDKTYTAQYEEVVNKYTITFKNWDGTLLDTYTVPYGETPKYAGNTPVKARTQEFSYTFAGWDQTIIPVNGDATYTAVFTSEKNSYKVTYVNDDANKTVLQESYVVYGENAYYHKATPTKAPTAQYTYTFAGWDNKATLVTDDVVYTAVYTSTVNKYKITFANEDGTVIQATEVEYGQMPKFEGDTPTKSATVEYTFTFTGWDKEIARVTGEAVYKATYSAKPITKDDISYKHFTVTFESNGGSSVVSQLVADGANAFKPEEPMRERYTFGGWYIDPECTKPFSFATPITSDITIYAKWVKGNQEAVVTYAVIGAGSIKWVLDSGEDIEITIERSEDNDTSASHLKGIQIDGENFYEYDVTEDKTVVTLKAFELNKYKTGKHVVTFIFDDGQATVELVVEDASKPTGLTTTEAEEVTPTEASTPVLTTDKTPSYLGLWIALGVVALVCICALPILIVKRRTIK